MSLESALALIESVKDDRVLFIGETIIDEYRFVTPLAKPPKESVLAVRYENKERYSGGVFAAAQHASSFCQTDILTFDAGITKTRFIEANYSRKLFELQKFKRNHPTGLMYGATHKPGMFAVTDFGHGFFGKDEIGKLCESPRFLAVACQTNAANHGFNLITKYPRADYIVIDEPEARLAAADRDSPIEAVMRALAARCACPRFVVTHGRHGAYGLFDGRFLHAPTHSGPPLDTMGAGDAFFAVTAPMARTGSLEDILAIGNAAGALKTQILGHRTSVTKPALIEYLHAHAR